MVFLFGLGCSQAFAASMRDRVLSDVTITRAGQEMVIRVAFNFPVRYLRHQPLTSGRELNIELQPIVTGSEELAGLRKRESLPAPADNPAGLVRVEYEGSEVVKPTVRVTLSKESTYTVRQGDDFRSLEIVLPVQREEAIPAAIAGTAPQPAAPVAQSRQGDLLQRGEAAMTAKEYMRAILIYTELLDSPDPEVRELARFRLATAQEYNGHLAHARAEYKNYLNDYPEGRDAKLARARLRALMSSRPKMMTGPGDLPATVEEGGWDHEYFGGISVYYDRDESMYEEDEDVVNLSSLTTGFDATWRARSDRFATKMVAVGNYEYSFLDRRDDRTRVNRLYLDFEDTEKTIISRLGRQSGNKGGVLTRFDGGQLGYRLMDKIRVNLVGGFPVNLPYDEPETDRSFYGINFDLGRFADHWDFNAYFINQLFDGIEDRRAVGGEARFIGKSASLYSLLDFDILYEDVSLFLLSGNYLLPNDRTRINVMADFRELPIISTGNALIGQLSPSLEELEETLGEDELRRLAEDRTLDSSFVTLGVSQPLTDTLQLAGDVSWSRIDGAPASGGVEAFESTGDEFYYFLQLIGNDLIKAGDISSLGLRYADTQFRDTYSLMLNSRYPFYDKFLLNPRMRVDYRENKTRPGEQWRFLPGLRLEYRWSRNWRFEIDGEYRYADQELEGVADGKDGYAISLGFRWDF